MPDTEQSPSRRRDLRAVQIAEPTDHLADEASEFLRLLADAESGRTALPFDEDEDETTSLDDDWEYDHPDPQPEQEEE